MRDLHNNITDKFVLNSGGVADNTAQVGQIIDRQGYDSLEYIINIGSIVDADATFTPLLEEGDDAALSDAVAVADADLLGTEAQASFQFDDDNESRRLGYKGHKRYTRLTITPANNASAAHFSASALLAAPSVAPTDNPSV